MFARRTAAEVFGGHQDLAAEFRIVQREGVHLVAGLIVTPVAEQIVPEAFAFDRFQEAGGNDLVGIDVLYIQRTGRSR